MANTPNINLVKPLGTDKALVSVINDNSDKIDAFAGSANTNMANTQNGYAIVVDGNNAPKAITAGQYLFIKNHSTLSAGGYHATANIANGAAITSSNVAADADGVVNGAFSALNSKLTPYVELGTVPNVLSFNKSYGKVHHFSFGSDAEWNPFSGNGGHGFYYAMPGSIEYGVLVLYTCVGIAVSKQQGGTFQAFQKVDLVSI